MDDILAQRLPRLLLTVLADWLHALKRLAQERAQELLVGDRRPQCVKRLLRAMCGAENKRRTAGTP
jgi:hypothetical protein